MGKKGGGKGKAQRLDLADAQDGEVSQEMLDHAQRLMVDLDAPQVFSVGPAKAKGEIMLDFAEGHPGDILHPRAANSVEGQCDTKTLKPPQTGWGNLHFRAKRNSQRQSGNGERSRGAKRIVQHQSGNGQHHL